ncbi:MAG: ferritin-like domain-containing protein [Actinomycetota bacterium]|nr:ferritin-like domain-containing protein [Actinomycetota bacterium]
MTSPVLNEKPPYRQSAMEELAADPASRKRFLKMLGGGSAAAAGFGLLLSACGGEDGEDGGGEVEISEGPDPAPPSAPPPKPAADVDIVNYALTLEYVEADFYEVVIESGLFTGAELDLLMAIGDHELQHVEALFNTVGALGGKPVAKPRTTFELGSASAVVALAATVENLGAAAYLGQAGKIESKEVLAAAISIHTVEARHAAALNRLAGRPPTPDGPFAKPATMAQVLPQVMPFIVS